MLSRLVKQGVWEPPNYPQSSEHSMAGNLISQVRTMLVARRRITRAGGRYFIYLPVEYNEVWEHWYENGAVLRMVIEVVEFKKASGNNPEASS
jgi:hypothetical protein